jgi:hypothetical protein
MKKEKGIATPMITRFILWDKNYLFQLTKELKEWLQSKLRKEDSGLCICSSSDSDDWNRCWEKTRRFCKTKGLDYHAFIEIFEEQVYMFNCECHLANTLDLEKVARQLGINCQEEGELKQ